MEGPEKIGLLRRDCRAASTHGFNLCSGFLYFIIGRNPRLPSNDEFINLVEEC
jgi:hypothetical protein